MTDVETALATIRRAVLEAPPSRRPELIATMRAELDDLAKSMAAAALDPVARAQLMARWPQLVAAQQARAKAARSTEPEKP
jgi:hypothetical protein